MGPTAQSLTWLTRGTKTAGLLCLLWTPCKACMGHLGVTLEVRALGKDHNNSSHKDNLSTYHQNWTALPILLLDRGRDSARGGGERAYLVF